jgi:hypothetical protein
VTRGELVACGFDTLHLRPQLRDFVVVAPIGSCDVANLALGAASELQQVVSALGHVAVWAVHGYTFATSTTANPYPCAVSANTRRTASRSFADFSGLVKTLSEDKAEADTRGAGKQTASETEISEKVKAVAVDFDAVVTLALGLFQELEADKAIVHNFENAEKLGRLIKAQIANSRALSVAHPVKASA